MSKGTSIEQELDNLYDLFSIFDDRKDQFIQIMDMAKESNSLSDEYKTDSNKISGCTSQAWVISKKNEDKTYNFYTDSDSLIVKGLLSILGTIFNGQNVNDIQKYNSEIILEKLGLKNVISSQRTNGFSNAVEKIKKVGNMNNTQNESIRLLRDVDAYMIPSGDEVRLLAGNLVRITQSLGGNYTVLINGNLVQIREENADALGFEIKKDKHPKKKTGTLEQQIWDQLKTCYDPEIPVNIVELGLIYDLTIKENNDINIKMTLTAPGCGMGPVLTEEVNRKVSGLDDSNNVDVELVWEPQWNRDMMSEEAQLELGML